MTNSDTNTTSLTAISNNNDKITKFNKHLKSSLPYIIGIVVSFIIAFYIRIIPADSVFIGDFVRFGGCPDPWYYIRLVEVIIHNYPQFLWYETYTYYPYAMSQTWAPGYAMILATIIMILGLGDPSTELIHTVSAYYPAFLGALVVIPVYFAAKWIFNDRRVGVFAAFLIAIAPGQFLSRSMIGFNDHHVAEVLFSTMVAMFMVMALIKSREYNITFDKIKSFDLASLKTPLIYFALAGFMIGVYSISWKGALFFTFMIGFYIAIQHIIDHMHNRDTSYLGVGGLVAFIIALIMVSLTPEIGGDKSKHLIGLAIGILAFPVLTAISLEFNRRGLNKYYYPLAAIVLAAVTYISARLFIPELYSLIGEIGTYFLREAGGLTIAEASPLLIRGGEFTLAPLWYTFGAGAIVSFLVLAYLLFISITQKNTQEKTFLIVWSVIIIWAMLQQNRFTYYYAVNVAILCSFAGIMVLDKAGWPQLINSLKNKLSNNGTESIEPKKKKKKSKTKSKNISDNQKPTIWHIVSVLIIVLVLVYPAASLSVEQASRDIGGLNGPWIDSMHWLKYNTPDNGVDYLEIYEPPPEDAEYYPYPEEAYGVMSWWDYGHWIMAIGERIPHANPFQRGARTAGAFFTAPSESDATDKLYEIHPNPDKAAARYIISDIEMATGKFHAMAAWAEEIDAWGASSSNYFMPVQTDMGTQIVPSEKYYNTMEARLHIFDGDGMQQYRMVYESPQGRSQEIAYKNIYNQLFGGDVPEVDSGYVKIFEFVEGALIEGEAPEGTEITLSNEIITNQGRTFSYTQTTESNGTFTFRVPYSTTGPIEGETNFETMPVGPYMISFDDTELEVDVDEQDVLDGNTITL